MWFGNLFDIYTGDNKNTTNKKLAKMKNNVEFQRVFADLLTTALDRYKINGLPESCSERVILQSLLWYGAVIFFIKDGELLALPGRATEDFN
ncbi:MAG: hypothetical protein LUC17_02055, partial [Oscillospiraceae bacterium]|nr:hypothetical protein [Oscillospiraceae bacterium]